MYSTNNDRNEIVREANNYLPGQKVSEENLRPTSEIPVKYRSVFQSFPSFNLMQSAVIDFVLQSDASLVISAPTGSGKTVVFELAIVRLMEKFKGIDPTNKTHKIVYMAPVKALCTERYSDWLKKLGPLGLRVIEITGDSLEHDLDAIKNYDLILTTPEKWDSMTRKWTNHRAIVQEISLFLIDEVHLLNEDRRGATLEAVVSRMKTVRETSLENEESQEPLRFVAVSAVIHNIEDISRWLGVNGNPAKFYKFDEEIRPIKIRKVVIGYNEDKSSFKFEMNLSYRLKIVLNDFSEGKPTLIFCSTRKSTHQTATVLSKMVDFEFTREQNQKLNEVVDHLYDNTLKDLVKKGMGYHHAGMIQSDRNRIEEIFRAGYLPVLIATSTLAMGVNLPAHLVIIKSTEHYVDGSCQEYSEAQILQMMGRAGRPQFGLSATAVIMTKQSKKAKYEKLVTGRDLVESCLHNYLIEHLNAEIVLRTVTDISVAMKWLRSSYLYVRACKNPRLYGLPGGLSEKEIERKLLEMCMRELNGLKKYELIQMSDSAYNVRPTENGKLMARHYIAFETMKIFMTIKGTEKLPELLDKICLCHEFQTVQLRWNERRVLNSLNQPKGRRTIRFPKKGKVTTRETKSYFSLIQACLGGIPIPDSSLVQESIRIMKISQRLVNGLVLYLWQQSHFQALESALVLHKCVRSKMWENSPHLTRQLPGIGPGLAILLANANKTSFRDIIESNPRDLERIINRQPPVGNQLQEAALQKPQYELGIEVDHDLCFAKITLTLKNAEAIKIDSSSNKSCLLVADSNNVLLKKDKIYDRTLVSSGGAYSFKVRINKNAGELIGVIISESTVGVDVKSSYNIFEKRFCTGSISLNQEEKEAQNKKPKVKPSKSSRPSLSSSKSKLTNYFEALKKPSREVSDSSPSSSKLDSSCVGEVTSTQDFIPLAPKSRYLNNLGNDNDPASNDEEDSIWLNDWFDDERETTDVEESNRTRNMVPPDSCQNDPSEGDRRSLPVICSPDSYSFDHRRIQTSKRSSSIDSSDAEPYSDVVTASSKNDIGVTVRTNNEKPAKKQRLETNFGTEIPSETPKDVFRVPNHQSPDDFDCLDLDLALRATNEQKNPASHREVVTVDGIKLDDLGLLSCSGIQNPKKNGDGFSLDELMDDSPTYLGSPMSKHDAKMTDPVPAENNLNDNVTVSDEETDDIENFLGTCDNSKGLPKLEDNPDENIVETDPKNGEGDEVSNEPLPPSKPKTVRSDAMDNEPDPIPSDSVYGNPWNDQNLDQTRTSQNSGQVIEANRRHSYGIETNCDQYERWGCSRRDGIGSVVREGYQRRQFQPTPSTDFFVPKTIVDYNNKSAQIAHRKWDSKDDSPYLFYRRERSHETEAFVNDETAWDSRSGIQQPIIMGRRNPSVPVVSHLPHYQNPAVPLPFGVFDIESLDYGSPLQPHPWSLPATRYLPNSEPVRSIRSEYGDPYENVYTSTMKKLIGTPKPVFDSRWANTNESTLREDLKLTFPTKFGPKDTLRDLRTGPASKNDSKLAFKVLHDPKGNPMLGRFPPFASVLETKRAPGFEFSEGHTRLPPKPVQLTKKERNRGVQKFQDENGNNFKNGQGGESTCVRLSSLMRNQMSEGFQLTSDRFCGTLPGGTFVAEENCLQEENGLDSEFIFDVEEQQPSAGFSFFDSQVALRDSMVRTNSDCLGNVQELPTLWNNKEEENYNFEHDLWYEAPANNNTSSQPFF